MYFCVSHVAGRKKNTGKLYLSEYQLSTNLRLYYVELTSLFSLVQ